MWVRVKMKAGHRMTGPFSGGMRDKKYFGGRGACMLIFIHGMLDSFKNHTLQTLRTWRIATLARRNQHKHSEWEEMAESVRQNSYKWDAGLKKIYV